jgi:ankyrin repeat protein
MSYSETITRVMISCIVVASLIGCHKSRVNSASDNSYLTNTSLGLSEREKALFKVAFDGNIAEMQSILASNESWAGGKNFPRSTPLHFAAASGQKDMIRFLVGQGEDVNTRDYHANIPLHLATDPDVAKFLLELGSDKNAKDRDGYTPLLKAVELNQIELVKLYLENGADVNITGPNSEMKTSLHLAVLAKNKKIVRLLLTHNANVNKREIENPPPLYSAVETSDLDIARMLLDKGANVDDFYKNYQTPLLLAVDQNKQDMVKLLLSHAAKINGIGKGPISSPLCFALEKGRKDIAKLLIAKGANLNSIGPHDPDPLIFALSERDFYSADLMFDKGAILNPKAQSSMARGATLDQ